MQLYNFKIKSYQVDVTAEVQNEYHVSLDGIYAGIIYSEFMDESPFLVWKTKDLIAEDLVQDIGAAIEDEDE